MSIFVTLTCPSCGAKLQIGNELERFACAHCGNEHMVKREGGLISIIPILEHLQKVELSVDKTASELAIQRIKEEGAKLRKASWEYIMNDLTQNPSLLTMIAGKQKPCATWFFNTSTKIENLGFQRKKIKFTVEEREVCEIIWNMSSQEIQQVIDFLPSRWNGKNLEEITAFGEKVLFFTKKVEALRVELDKHREIVSL
ncbi:MAG: zinc ribbon domain-containing protein [Chloroflexi bacterium]|nr:zinc ribbon domain-containing protein [Chloroflexota bacterium]